MLSSNSSSRRDISLMYTHSQRVSFLNRLAICNLNKLPRMDSTLDSLQTIHTCNPSHRNNLLNKQDFPALPFRALCLIIPTRSRRQNPFNRCQQAQTILLLRYPRLRLLNNHARPSHPLYLRFQNNNLNIQHLFPRKTHPSQHPRNNNQPTKINSTFCCHKEIRWAKILSEIPANFVSPLTTNGPATLTPQDKVSDRA